MIIPLPNIKYNLEEATKYYNELDTKYQHLHWNYFDDHPNHAYVDPKNNMKELHGWGLQTIYEDLRFPYHLDIDPHDEGPEYFKDTELVFGFGKQALDFFDDPFRSFLIVMPPGTYIDKWFPPKGNPHNIVLIPIFSNGKMLVRSHDSPTVSEEVLVQGNIIMLDTSVESELRNNGTFDVIFIALNIPLDTVGYIKQRTGTI